MKNAPVYKTAEVLKIEEWEHEGLAALVGPLSRGELADKFDMRSACGSVLCIGGHVASRSEVYDWFSAWKHVNYHCSFPLRRLYHPPHDLDCIHSGWNASQQQAARAIVNFLVTGDPQWDAVMAEPSDV